MKIIVTGATGFIGRNVAEYFHKIGYEVLGLGRNKKIGAELLRLGIRFVAVDIRDKNEVVKNFESADFIVHCAGKSADWGKFSEFYDVNVLGTQNIVSACIKYDIKRIIFISTPSVYYSGKDRFKVSEEESLPQKQFSYGRTKIIAENMLLNLTSAGFRTIVLRPRAVYGKYDNVILPRILKLSEKKRFPLINGGKAVVDITYIGNLITAIALCFSANENVWNNIFNICNGEPTTIKEWFSMVLSTYNRSFDPKTIPNSVAHIVASANEMIAQIPFCTNKPQMTRFSVGYMATSLTMSIEKARILLNYYPIVGNREGYEIIRQSSHCSAKGG